ncbi:unnamed protein product [Clonostachys solani]|uniref:Uncharacterized protein n=1 Tax=Clonostachys solani TaxID=160281 RepID=A0A9P0EL15_9HYPO|nr:unnamed protein product [Clonostachys solani]
MTRQRRMAKKKAPKIAPTAMKTVPSGARECCMNGAFTVGGTAAGAYVGTPYFPVSDAVMRILPSEVEVEVVFEEVVEVVDVFEEELDVVELFSSSIPT